MTQEEIGKWLEGTSDELKYIVALEMDDNTNIANVITHNPDGIKELKRVKYEPFLWCKDIKSLRLFEGDNTLRDRYAVEFGIAIIENDKYSYKIQKLRTDDEPRLEDGYKYIIKSTKSFSSIKKFLTKGGVNFFGKNKDDFFYLKTEEQFLIQKNTRFFKGYELYSDVHKVVFDIETTGLDPIKDKIFFIGIKDNKGYTKVLVNEDIDNPSCEALLIESFFTEIRNLKPAIIGGYNSENFDFNFICLKAEKYGLIKNITTSLSKAYGNTPKPIKRIPNQSIKIGAESENYTKTVLWGCSVIDIMFSVRRAKALNAEIESHGLKYITKYFNINKPDRMYHKDKYGTIYEVYKQNKNFIINSADSNYKIVPNELQETPEVYLAKNSNYDKIITGSEIIYQYLLDDLEETAKVDEIVNQESFMITKLLPATFSRKCIMGNAAMWNLLMSAWNYALDVAIPFKTKKRDFTGGLSRIFKIGFTKIIQKTDFAGLYPSIKLAHNAFPKCDITNGIKGFLQYFVDNRNIYKLEQKKCEDNGEWDKANLYSAKASPLKAFNNANFGAEGSEYFNWAEMDIAETVTCFGRQYLRKMVAFFMKYGLEPLVLDTDGCNFSVPLTVNYDIYGDKLSEPTPLESLRYNGKNGVEALLKKLNETLPKPIKIDDDGKWLATINISAKNYINMINEKKVKFIGNTIKSSTLSDYMKSFIRTSSLLLLKEKSVEFVEMFYSFVSEIISRDVAVTKLLSKGKVKKELIDYICRGTNKKGKLLPKQAHMELILRDCLPADVIKIIEDHRNTGNFRNEVAKILKNYNIPYGLGDTVYYINTGVKKLSGDSSIDKDGNLLCTMVKNIEEVSTLEYNIAKYLDSFIKKAKNLFVVFKPEVRKLLSKPFVEVTKNKTKYISLKKYEFAESDLVLVNENKQLVDKDLMTMELKEVNYWLRLDANEELKNRLGNIKAKDIFPDYILPDLTSKTKVLNKKDEKMFFVVTADANEIYKSMFFNHIQKNDCFEYIGEIKKSEYILVVRDGVQINIPKSFGILLPQSEVNDYIIANTDISQTFDEETMSAFI